MRGTAALHDEALHGAAEALGIFTRIGAAEARAELVRWLAGQW